MARHNLERPLAKELNFFLENDRHLLPLLKDYLSRLNPELKCKKLPSREAASMNGADTTPSEETVFGEEDYSAIRNPDGSVSAFCMDVLAQKEAGGNNIVNGYWRAIAGSLKAGLSPHRLRIISIINHNNIHWTASVAKIQLEKWLLSYLRQRFARFAPDTLPHLPLHTIIEQIEEALREKRTNEKELVGARSIDILHYDSYVPKNTPENKDMDYYSGYFDTYVDTLSTFRAANEEKRRVKVRSMLCQSQQGNTCGDHALYNGFVVGVLGKPQLAFYPSNVLRSYSVSLFEKEDPNDARRIKLDKHLRDWIIAIAEKGASNRLPNTQKNKNGIHPGEPLHMQNVTPMDHLIEGESTMTNGVGQPGQQPTDQPSQQAAQQAQAEQQTTEARNQEQQQTAQQTQAAENKAQTEQQITEARNQKQQQTQEEQKNIQATQLEEEKTKIAKAAADNIVEFSADLTSSTRPESLKVEAMKLTAAKQSSDTPPISSTSLSTPQTSSPVYLPSFNKEPAPIETLKDLLKGTAAESWPVAENGSQAKAENPNSKEHISLAGNKPEAYQIRGTAHELVGEIAAKVWQDNKIPLSVSALTHEALIKALIAFAQNKGNVDAITKMTVNNKPVTNLDEIKKMAKQECSPQEKSPPTASSHFGAVTPPPASSPTEGRAAPTLPSASSPTEERASSPRP